MLVVLLLTFMSLQELYARSMHVEPAAAGDGGRKMFGWLRS